MERKSLLKSIQWENGKLILLDQTKLPVEKVFLEIEDVEDVWDAIRELKVRGAPAIGVAAAFGIVLGVKGAPEGNFNEFYDVFRAKKEYLSSSRPTAVNLFWALQRMEEYVLLHKDWAIADLKNGLLVEAQAIQKEDEEVCSSIGMHGLTLLRDGMGVLTHCNAGSLATAGLGTALAPIYMAMEKGWNLRVYADETRPLLQGARLTTWELMQAGVDVTLITDNMAAHVMARGWIDSVIVGCDRVAANGDFANKIGTYGVAILAKEHGIPFYVAAPLSTIDLNTPTGEQIVIEERKAEEVTMGFGKRTAPEGVKVYNPAFDVTPHRYITAIITEKGIIYPPFAEGLRTLYLQENGVS